MAAAPLIAKQIAPEPLRVIDISRVVRPLRFIGFGRYILLIVSIQALAGSLETLLTDSKETAAVVGALVGIIVFGFCAWVGWKSIGVLNSILYSKTLWAYLFICAVGGFLLLSGAANIFLNRKNLFDNEAQFIDVFVTIWSGLFLTFGGAAAIWAISFVRNRKIPDLNAPLSGFLRKSLALYENTPAKRLPPAHPWRGAWFLLLGGGALLIFTAIPLEFFVKHHIAQQIDLIRSAMFGLLIYARQCFQPAFQSVMTADARPPVLFLRSFSDDEKLQYQSADRALFDFSLESRLADHFTAIGPFIAVGEPKDKSPHLGAARVALSNDAWQGSVLDWIGSSKLVLIMAGATHWIGWEMGKVLEMGAAQRAIVLFPQTRRQWRPFRKKKRRKIAPEDRLQVVRNVFEGTPWEAGLLQLTDAKKIRSVIFEPDGRVTAIVSKPKSRDSYHLAALIAHYLMLRREQSELDFAAAPAPTRSPASLKARALAVAIDSFAFVCLYALALVALPPVFATWWGAVTGVFAFLVFCSVVEFWTGASPGKSIAGLRVEMVHAARRSALACFIRNALRLIDGMAFYLPGFIIALNHPLRQRAGDQAAATIVVSGKSRFWVRISLAAGGLALLFAFVVQAPNAVTTLEISMLPFRPLPKQLLVSATGNLEVGNFDYVDGSKHHAGSYKPGESVSLQYEVAGFKRGPASVAHVVAETTIVDPYGLLVRPPERTDFRKAISRSDRISESISLPLPDYAPRGNYFVDIKVHDRVAHSNYEFKPSFNVEADSVPEAYSPVIRQLELSTSKDSFSNDPLLVNAPAQIYARAEIYGLHLRNNRQDASVSAVLQDSAGNVIWRDDNLLHLDQEFFYHPPTLGAVVTSSLILKDGFPKGGYAETYIVKDNVSRAVTTRSTAFQVR